MICRVCHDRKVIKPVDKDETADFCSPERHREFVWRTFAGLKTDFANHPEQPLWQQLAEARKSPMRQAAIRAMMCCSS
jgi:hypothetical protein